MVRIQTDKNTIVEIEKGRDVERIIEYYQQSRSKNPSDESYNFEIDLT
ncbi:MAG: hypothetical protein ACK5MK_09385 [Dysgonomonas sp.]